MEQIPDAPWVRDAEMYGPPYDEVICPCCGEECETIYSDQNGTVFACDKCLEQQDAWDWKQEQIEAERPE